MLFSEFQAGTGCKDNLFNHKVYEDLEILYMNSDKSKEEIYEYGKKLVDNSKTEAELALEKQIREEITKQKELLKEYTESAKRYMEYHKDSVGDTYWRDQAKWYKQLARTVKQEIAGLKWVLE